jgi:hypothetical protein
MSKSSQVKSSQFQRQNHDTGGGGKKVDFYHDIICGWPLKPTTVRWNCSDSCKDIQSLSSVQFHPTLCKATPIDGNNFKFCRKEL